MDATCVGMFQTNVAAEAVLKRPARKKPAAHRTWTQAVDLQVRESRKEHHGPTRAEWFALTNVVHE
eukprot:3585329-Amphidinium_carterae.1